MARYIINKQEDISRYQHLIDELARELSSPQNLQPFILEERIGATASRHIHVIWQKWSGMSDEVRSAVILQAYHQAESAEAEDITIAIGVTPQEALDFGLLPFHLRSLRRETDELSADSYSKVIESASHDTILGMHSSQLRFPTLEAAEEAKRLVEQSLPGSHWAIVQEVEQAV